MTDYKSYEETTMLPLTKDLVFKAVFGSDTKESNAALKALLNCLLERQDDPIQWVECKNPFTYQERKEDKSGIMDIRAQLNSGEIIDLEMQVNHLEHFRNRTVFYLGKMISKSLDKGQSYDKMKKSILISIVVPVLFPETDQVYHCFYLTERTTKSILNDIAQLRFLELGKLHPESCSIEELDPIELVGMYFKYASDENHKDYITLLKGGPIGEVISLSEPILRKISADERLREMLEDQERYEHDEATRKFEREQAEARIRKLREDYEVNHAALVASQAELVASQTALAADQEAFAADQEALAADQEALAADQEALSREREIVFREREVVFREREFMASQKELTAKLIAENRFDDLKRMIENTDYQNQLLEEYHLLSQE